MLPPAQHQVAPPQPRYPQYSQQNGIPPQSGGYLPQQHGGSNQPQRYPQYPQPQMSQGPGQMHLPSQGGQQHPSQQNQSGYPGYPQQNGLPPQSSGGDSQQQRYHQYPQSQQAQMPPGPGPGQMPPGPRQMPPGPGQMPPGPGQMPPGPRQFPSGPGQTPLGPGQVPPGPGQMNLPSQAGQQPHQQPRYPMYPQPQQNGLPPPQHAGDGHPRYPQYPQAQMPPGPGQMPMPPQGGGYPGQPPMPPDGGVGMSPYGQPPSGSQGRKLDPEQMPSPISVMQEDQQSRGGIFQTNQRGLLPPLVTTKFQVDDQGNSSPRFIRSTMYAVPAQPDMIKQTAVPFALVVNPFANPAPDEQQLMCVDLGAVGPVRCIRCKAYMSPLMQFIDGGRRFQCLLCKATTEVPPEYFQHLDHTGQRADKWDRPELWRGSYEFMATTDYCRNSVLPKEPGYIFAIDVSYNNVKSGLVNLLCANMASLLQSLPPHTPVGFITYNSKVHFYNIDPNLAQPQMVIVPDVLDMFMPILDGFFVPRGQAMASIESLMAQIPLMFADTKETEGTIAAGIQGGMEALKASERVGKVLVFHSSLPTSEPGKLKNREGDRRLLGTDKEKAVLTPQTTHYNNLAQDCVGCGVCVDLYLFNNSYVDVATIGQVARVTGGSVNKYTYFQADVDGARVLGDLAMHLGRATAFDAVMRVRTSTGVRPTDFFGHFYMANATDVELAGVDSSKSVAVEIKHDDKLTDEDGVYIQVALLYTSIYGQRRLRIHNLALNTCLQMADLYRSCELDTVVNFLAKQSISRSIETSPQTMKDGIIQRSAQMLATYRKHCANPSQPGQLILPECLKLLPLYVNCILRSDAIAGGQDLTPDDRSWIMFTVMTMGVETTVHHFYPQLFAIAGPEIESTKVFTPVPVRCSQEKLREDSAYILENGIYIFMWIGSVIDPNWLQDIFGVSNLGQLNTESITELPDQITTDESLRLKSLIRKLRTDRNRHMRLTVIRQRDKLELVMKKFLVEDRSSDGHSSYVDFLCHMHKEIRAVLNQ